MTPEEKKWNESYRKASKRVENIKNFYTHLITFIVINIFLVIINYWTYWDYQWFWFALFGWGIGLVLHGINTFFISDDWEERKIREFMDKDNLD